MNYFYYIKTFTPILIQYAPEGGINQSVTLRIFDAKTFTICYLIT